MSVSPLGPADQRSQADLCRRVAQDREGQKRNASRNRKIDLNAIIAYSAIIIDAERAVMASIMIRSIDDTLKRRLRVRAAEHGRSMEEEVREILREAIGESPPPRDLAAAIRARVAPVGRIDLDVPARQPMRERVSFD